MSARSHVDVSERRLRPIYDCLDNGNNKKAIQEADKVLKKQKDFSCAKVLKALALLRLGRHDESVNLLKDVHAKSPTDEPSLQAMSICYREMHRLDLIADMYSNAHKAAPNNEEILTALFMAYVRLGDYKKQQQTAMTLHRLKPQKNPYYFWAIMSIVMQAHVSDDKLAKSMFLPLAERMTQKYVAEEKIEAEAEVQMYLIILEQLGKYDEALTVVTGSLGEKLTNELDFRDIKVANLYANLENWPKMNAAFRKLLKKEPDHWRYYQEYYRSLFSLIDSKWTPDSDNSPEELVDHTVERALHFLNEQQEAAKDSPRPLRGVYLARLELVRLLREKGNKDEDKLGDPLELLKQYYQTFGNKLCFFTDLKNFVGLIKEEEREKFVQSLLEESGFVSENNEIIVAKDPKQMQSHLGLLQVGRYFSLQDRLDEEGKLSVIRDLLHHYREGLKLGNNLLSTDLQYSDPYLVMAVHLIHDIWEQTGNNDMIWQGILMLENGLKKSPSNFQFKLLLIRFYCLMGAFSPCPGLFESMEIKHIQNDSLGYMLANHIGRLGQWSHAGALYDVMLRFFTVNHKDTTEYLISSYKYGSFTKVHEFVRFRERLQKSIQYASATAERLLLDMVMETENHQRTEQILRFMEIDPEKDKTDWNDLRDNRDFNVIHDWAPPERSFNTQLQDISFNEERAWLRIRNLLVRCLAAAVQITILAPSGTINGNSGEESRTRPSDILSDLITQLTDHLDTCKPEWMEKKHYLLGGPFRTRIATYLSLDLGAILVRLMEMVLYCHSLAENGLDKADKNTEESTRSFVVTQLTELISKNRCCLITGEDGRKQFHPDLLETLVLISECFGQVVLLLGVCNKLLLPSKAQITKRNKRKKDNPIEQPETFVGINGLVSELCGVGDSLIAAFNDTDPGTLSVDLASLNLAGDTHLMESEESLEKAMWSRVENSYKQSASEHSTFIQLKKCYLNTLKL